MKAVAEELGVAGNSGLIEKIINFQRIYKGNAHWEEAPSCEKLSHSRTASLSSMTEGLCRNL